MTKVNGSVSGGMHPNVAAADGDWASLLGGSCYVDEVACYKTSDVTGDSVSVGVLSSVYHIGYCVGYVSINCSSWVSPDRLDVRERVIRLDDS